MNKRLLKKTVLVACIAIVLLGIIGHTAVRLIAQSCLCCRADKLSSIDIWAQPFYCWYDS